MGFLLGEANMKRQIGYFILVALFTVPFLGSTPAFSQDQGFYAGANFGQSKLKDACSGVASCDDKDTSLSIFGGYQFNKNFGGEIAYTDLGKATAPGASLEATGFEFSAVGTLPLNPQWSLYGKLGFFMWDADVNPGGFSEDGTDLTYAIGVRWNFAKNLAAQAQWQRYKLDDLDVDVLGIGILFRF
jgi:outer membrane protein with beta-barrel domain